MSAVKKIASNFIIQVAGRILALILGLFIIGLMMRYLGPQNYGYYSIAISFLQVFGIIADFGLYLITLRYLGEVENIKEEERKKRVSYVMNNIFTLRVLSALVFYGGAFFLSFLFNYPLAVKTAVGILSGSLFFCTLIQTLSAFYQQTFKTKKIFIGEVLGKIVTLGLMIWFVKSDYGFFSIVSVFVLGNLINFLVLFLSARKQISLKFDFDFSFWLEIIKKSWPVGLAIVLNVFYFKMDTLILSFYEPAEAVGFYGGCYRILEVLITIPPLFLGLVLPRLVQFYRAKDSINFKKFFQKSFDFLLMLALPLTAGGFVLGKRIMILLGGSKFAPAGGILRVVIFACGILFVGELFKQIAVGLGKQKQILPFYFLTAVISLIGYFIFIPKYSYWGAAGITIFSEALMFIFSLGLFYKTTNILPQMKFFLKSLGATLIMTLFLFCLISWNLFLLILTGIVIYFVILYLFKGFDKELIKEVVKIKW